VSSPEREAAQRYNPRIEFCGWDDARVEIEELDTGDFYKVADIDPLLATCDAEIASLRARVAEMEARIASLEEGLRPFAAVGRVVDFYVEDALPNEAQRTFPYHVIKCDEDGPARVTLDLDDFRRARALLTPAGGENERLQGRDL
jgi:hypothetical protein